MSAWTVASTPAQNASRDVVDWMGWPRSWRWYPLVGKLTYRPLEVYDTLDDPRADVTRMVISALVAIYPGYARNPRNQF
jgi:hypothetical protein